MNNNIDKISKNFELNKIQGISVEIGIYLSSISEVKSFKFEKGKNLKTNKYYIIIELYKFDINEIKKIFKDLVEFIEYSNFTAYSCDIDREDKKVSYELISVKHDNKGYYCKLDFSGPHPLDDQKVLPTKPEHQSKKK